MQKKKDNVLILGQEYFSLKDTLQILRDIKLPKQISAIKNESELKKITDELNYSASWYFTFKNLRDRPKNSETIKALEKVQKTASDFYQCLNELDDYTKYFCLKPIYSATGIAEHIAGRAKEEIEKINKKSEKSDLGRPRGASPRKKFICFLADSYESITNRPAALSRLSRNKPGGPFFRFVKSCLNQVEENPNDEALFTSIKEALKNPSMYNQWRRPFKIRK